MDKIHQLEENYNMYISNIPKWLPEGLVSVDISLLNHLNLLHSFSEPDTGASTNMTRNFQVVETPEKITLFNSEFVVWIVPQRERQMPVTHVLIALEKEKSLHLELAFSAAGVYNSSRLVLRVLEKMLQEIQETEKALQKLLP